LLQALGSQPARAQVQPFPAGFHSQRIATNGTTLYVRTGGSGPPVVLLHGYGETGDMWSALAAKLAPHYTVIVPDLRGMGYSARPRGTVLVVASPSVVDLLARACPRAPRPELLAVGPTTAASARAAGWSPAAVAAEPTLNALSSAILGLLANR
jgi:pimeloyl-ACP methyl ester carboxylesterase